MKKLFLLLAMFIPALAGAQTVTVSGNLNTFGTGAVTARSYVRFELRNCNGNIPRVVGTAVLIPPFQDFYPNGSGVISGTLYGNDVITCDVINNSYYDVTIFWTGQAYYTKSFKITGSTFNLNNANPLVQSATNPPNISVLINPGASQTITQPSNTAFNVLGGNGLSLSGSLFTVSGTPATTGGVVYGSGSGALAVSNAGGAGTLNLQSTSGGAPFWGSGTNGSGTPLISNTSNPASAGAIRLAHADVINFRNNANSGDVAAIAIGNAFGNDFITLSGNASNQGVFIAGQGTAADFIDLYTNGGVLATYFTNNAPSSNGAASGVFRMTSAGKVCWRNNAGSGDICVGINGSDQLQTPSIQLGSNAVITSTTATMGVTLKKGSAAGNYATTSATYVDVDGTNLAFTVTVPTGWKASIVASLTGSESVAANAFVAITDGTTVLTEAYFNSASFVGIPLAWVFTGDGASHTFKLRFKSDGTNTLTVTNNTTTVVPTIIVTLMPSN